VKAKTPFLFDALQALFGWDLGRFGVFNQTGVKAWDAGLNHRQFNPLDQIPSRISYR